MSLSTWDQREESRFKDRTDWERGMWDEEPDRVEWRWLGPPRLACLIVRGPSGALCGYVGVPPGHPRHGIGTEWAGPNNDIECHGGLTYADKCQAGGHICHVAQPGEAEEVWWLGFDCNHSWDVAPARDAHFLGRHFAEHGSTYKSIAYVRHQVEQLAEQLCRVAKGLPAREEEP